MTLAFLRMWGRGTLTIFPVLAPLIVPEATLVTNWNAVISCECKMRRLDQLISKAPSSSHVPGFLICLKGDNLKRKLNRVMN